MNENYYYYLASSSFALLATGALYLGYTMYKSQKEPAVAAPEVIDTLADHRKMCYAAGFIMLIIGVINLWGISYESPIQRMSLRG